MPIVKKGEGSNVKDYRGVTLMPTLYKIYVSILAKRLKKEMDEKSMIPPNQMRLRKGMGVIGNIYVLNYLVHRRIRKKNRVMVVMFVDLKAAFDSVDREQLEKSFIRCGVKEGLKSRIMEIFRETKSKVRASDESGETVSMARGVRQGCPLSSHVFNLLLGDIEEEMRMKEWGGVRLGEERIDSLLYADNIVLLAEDEEGIAGLITGLEKYLDGKKLVLSIDKSKVMRFRKGKGRKKKWVAWWKDRKLEEVKECKYLDIRCR